VQSVAVSVASFLIAVISSVQCALRGGLLCSRALMRCVYASPLASAPVVSCARVSAPRRLGLLCARRAAGAVRIAVRLGASASLATFVPCAMRRRRRSKLRLALRPLLVPSTEAVRQHGGSS
jgi:hypothetical protein